MYKHNEIVSILNAAGKHIIEFPGIMPNPTYAKVQEGEKLAKENQVDLILAVGGGAVSDYCKIVSAQAKLDEDIWTMKMEKHTYPNRFIPLGTIVTYWNLTDYTIGTYGQELPSDSLDSVIVAIKEATVVVIGSMEKYRTVLLMVASCILFSKELPQKSGC